MSGALQGAGSVSDTGDALYSVPVIVPEGRAGLTPSLSFNYDSARGDGVMGQGWSFATGAQVIHRCPSTVAQDTIASGIDYTSDDRLCLNGRRLVMVSDSTSTTYGISGSEYRTEVATFMQVKALGPTGSAPNYFVVKDRNGMKYRFGYVGSGHDARIQAAGSSVIRIWALGQVEDSHGNKIKYRYNETNANGNYSLDKIEYVFNSSGVPKYTIEFDYTNRARDERTSYQYGSVITRDELLSTVRVKHGASLIRRYELDYDSAVLGGTGRNRLEYITHCMIENTDPANTAEKCVKPLTVSWLYGSSGWGPAANPASTSGEQYLIADWDGDGHDDVLYSTGSPKKWSIRSGASNLSTTVSTNVPAKESEGSGSNEVFYEYLTLDYNGDGRQDILQVESGPGAGDWHVYKSQATGPAYSSAINIGGGGSSPNDGTAVGHAIIADFNADGLDDVLTISGTKIRAYESNGTGFEAPADVAGPFNIGGFYSGTTVLGSSINSICCAFNLNDDGIPDLRVRLSTLEEELIIIGEEEPRSNFYTTRSWVYLVSTGSGYQLHTQLNENEARQWESLLDINGDGLDDISHFGNGQQPQVLINNGETFEAAVPGPPLPVGGVVENAFIADYDNDGRMDRLFKMSTGKLWVMRSTGENFATADDLGDYGTNLATADLDGDGFSEILEEVAGAELPSPMTIPVPSNSCPGGQGNQCIYDEEPPPVLPPPATNTVNVRWHTSPHSDVVDTITDGYGNYVDFDFSAVAQYAGYSLDHSKAAATNVRPAWGGIHVVSSITMNDGIVVDAGTGAQGSYSIDYEYENALTETTGRGFLGFERTFATDSRNQIYTVTEFEQAFPLIGLQNTRNTYQPDGAGYPSDSPIVERIFTWIDEPVGTQSNPGRYFVYLDTEDTVTFDVGGVGTNGQGLLRRFVDYDYKDGIYGQLQTVTRTVSSPPISPTQTHTSVTNYVPVAPGTSDYCSSLYSVVSETRSQTGVVYGGQINRATSFETDTTKCRIDGETRFSTAGIEFRSKYDYTYDAYGNRTDIQHSQVGTPTFGNGLNFEVRRQAIEFDADDLFPSELIQCSGDDPLGSCLASDFDSVSSSMDFVDELGLPKSRQIPTIFDSGSSDTTVDRLFDGLGRITEEDFPNGEKITIDYFDCADQGVSCWAASAATKVVMTTETDQDRTLFYDSLGRQVGEEYASYIDEASATVRAQTTYDNLGRVFEQTTPSADSTFLYKTTYQYDLIGRVKTVNQPIDEASATGRITTYAYSLFDVTKTDPGTAQLGNGVTKQVFDALGRLIESYDEANRRVKYDYDSWNSLRMTTNGEGADSTIIMSTYDSRGRLASMDDPDRGLTQYKYDPSNALVWMKDAKDQERTYKYDDLGRLVKRTDGVIRDTSGTIVNSGIDSVFTYYTNKTTDNGFSRMKSHQQNPGANGPKVEYFYDSLGRVDQTDTTISTYSGFPVAGTFIVEQDYNTVGQLNSITYPDSSHTTTPFGVKYEYENGVVKRVSNKDNMSVWYYQLKSRDVWGGIKTTEYGNGVVNTHVRDEASGRVSDIESENGGTKFRDYSYVWDKVGNLETRTRHMTGSMTADLVENFTYDSRYRLTEAKVGTCAGNAPECFLELDYFDNGNIKKKTNLGDTYSYETTGTNGGPHAVTEIKDGGTVVQSFDYDDNGNMTYRGSPTNTISWTSFDKPSQIKRGSNVVSNLFYDANYQRYRQVETLFNESAETLYIGGIFERHTSILQANSLPVIGYRHYIFANGERIATLSDIEATENTDGDSIVDASDNCTLVDNENQRDTNGDGFGNICDPDLNNDGAVNFLDTSIYLTHHLTQFGDPNYNEDADFNGDGAINYVDFALFPTYFSLGRPGPGRSAELGQHVQYFHTDHLGSIDAITDSNGELVAEYNYDAFGLRRLADTWEYDNVALPEGLDWETTTRGFTDHEHLRELNLIHMNGRVYDPVVGRMISADPFVPYPIDSQSFNRYSYVQNNPLSRIDPTGYTDSNNLEETLTTATPDAPGGIESPPGTLAQINQGGSNGARGGNNSSGEPGTDFGQSDSGGDEGNSQEKPGPLEEVEVTAFRDPRTGRVFGSVRNNPAWHVAVNAMLDGRLTFREARRISQLNIDPNLILVTDGDQLIYIMQGGLWDADEGKYRGGFIFGVNDFLVYGTNNLILLNSEGEFGEGAELMLQAGPFDFDQQEDRSGERNFFTEQGRMVVEGGHPGSATRFIIAPRGTPIIVPPL